MYISLYFSSDFNPHENLILKIFLTYYLTSKQKLVSSQLDFQAQFLKKN